MVFYDLNRHSGTNLRVRSLRFRRSGFSRDAGSRFAATSMWLLTSECRSRGNMYCGPRPGERSPGLFCGIWEIIRSDYPVCRAYEQSLRYMGNNRLGLSCLSGIWVLAAVYTQESYGYRGAYDFSCGMGQMKICICRKWIRARKIRKIKADIIPQKSYIYRTVDILYWKILKSRWTQAKGC